MRYQLLEETPTHGQWKWEMERATRAVQNYSLFLKEGQGRTLVESQVRSSAVHTISCESCKDGPNPVDPIPLLLERIERDESIKVRRQAVGMLAHHRMPDSRVLPVFKRLLADEEDRKLRLHAEQGLKRYASAGLAD